MISLYIIFLIFIIFKYTNGQSTTIPLNDNQIFSSNITSGVHQHYFFSTSSVSKSIINQNSIGPSPLINSIITTKDNKTTTNTIIKRDPTTPIYLTLTSCSQPIPPPHYTGIIPTIDLYISTDGGNTLPGPTKNQNNDTVDKSKPGRISWQNDQIDNLWIGVVAPTLTEGWTGEWKYEIGLSTNQWMHPLFSQNDSMTLEDTDNTHALFLTKPIIMPQHNNITTLITLNVPKELKYSYCAIKSYQISSPVNVTNRPLPDNYIQQYIMVSNLTQSQSYTAYMIETMPGGVTGISVPLLLRMKNDPTCRLIYNLDFCDQVAYSVPTDANQDIWNITRSYDRQAQALFDPFSTALKQYNCNSTQYSLVRNCDDCYRDYKRWLCSVTIPRCTTLATDEQQQQNANNNSNDSMVMMKPLPTPSVRNVLFNQSRNKWIDQTYQLSSNGWTELLPCIDICYQVVQSCPPFLQFNCPEGDLARLQYGYWKTQQNESLGTVYDLNHPTCNRVGLNTSLLVISRGILNYEPSFILFILSLIFNIYIAINK
ncbi:stretch-activated Ca2+-permeable channel component-domain-containing protein [Cunninghamella echinulata]|nr:stretch-activated Ca2+-permeable channel component-domain-containing protein [Cunninghamella echinulata]